MYELTHDNNKIPTQKTFLMHLVNDER